MWKIHLNIIPTSHFLVGRGVISKENELCALCKNGVETSVHLFLECIVTRKIWHDVSAWWQVTYLLNGIGSLTALWESSRCFPTKRLRSVWRVIISATLWNIWLSRNQIVFGKGEDIINSISSLIKMTALEWCQAMNLIHQNAGKRWVLNPSGAVSETEEKHFNELISCGSELIPFVDGSWKEKRWQYSSWNRRAYF